MPEPVVANTDAPAGRRLSQDGKAPRGGRHVAPPEADPEHTSHRVGATGDMTASPVKA